MSFLQKLRQYRQKQGIFPIDYNKQTTLVDALQIKYWKRRSTSLYIGLAVLVSFSVASVVLQAVRVGQEHFDDVDDEGFLKDLSSNEVAKK